MPPLSRFQPIPVLWSLAAMSVNGLIRSVVAALALALLAGCDAHDMGDPPRPMGNFAMGLNIVVPETAKTIALSRQATPEEWKTVMTAAMQERFGSYSGNKLFDFGISIDGYLLAPPGVPVVASPRSALIITVNVWDDAKKQLLVKGGKRLTIIEGVSADSFIGSGWTQNKQAQMKKLADNAAKAVQDYMLDHPEWLGMPPKSSSTTSTPPAAATAVPPLPVVRPPPSQIP
jgi:hypothetical protein